MLTKAQLEDLETIKFFIPLQMKHVEITDKDVTDFLELSEHGLHKERIGMSTIDGLNALFQGKRWRGIHMEMWEDGVMSGDVPYSVLFEDIPDSVIRFAAKEMFKGADKNLILSYAKA